jgi:hypothetical protein
MFSAGFGLYKTLNKPDKPKEVTTGICQIPPPLSPEKLAATNSRMN